MSVGPSIRSSVRPSVCLSITFLKYHLFRLFIIIKFQSINVSSLCICIFNTAPAQPSTSFALFCACSFICYLFIFCRHMMLVTLLYRFVAPLVFCKHIVGLRVFLLYFTTPAQHKHTVSHISFDEHSFKETNKR